MASFTNDMSERRSPIHAWYLLLGGSTTNTEPFATRGNQSDTRPSPRASHSQSEERARPHQRNRLAWLNYSPPAYANRIRFPAGSLPDYRMWESCRKMPLAGGFSRGYPDKVDLKRLYTEVAYAIGSEFIRHALDDSAPIADFQGNKKRILYCQMWGDTGATANEQTSEDKIYLKLLYTEVAYAIGSEFIRHALDISAPIANLQGNKKRILYCQMRGNTGATANEQTSEDGNTARLARRSYEALGVRVRVARIAPSLLDIGRRGELILCQESVPLSYASLPHSIKAQNTLVLYGVDTATCSENCTAHVNMASPISNMLQLCPPIRAWEPTCQSPNPTRGKYFPACSRQSLETCKLRVLSFGIRLNSTVLYVVEPESFLHWLQRRCEATPFLTELHVIGAHNCKAVQLLEQGYQNVSDKLVYLCNTQKSLPIRDEFVHQNLANQRMAIAASNEFRITTYTVEPMEQRHYTKQKLLTNVRLVIGERSREMEDPRGGYGDLSSRLDNKTCNNSNDPVTKVVLNHSALQHNLLAENWKIHEFNDLQARLYSRMYKYVDINCTLVVCCHSGRRLLGQPSPGGVKHCVDQWLNTLAASFRAVGVYKRERERERERDLPVMAANEQVTYARNVFTFVMPKAAHIIGYGGRPRLRHMLSRRLLAVAGTARSPACLNVVPRRNYMMVPLMGVCSFSDWLREGLDTGLVSNWLLRVAESSLLAMLLGIRNVICLLIRPEFTK
ncbi:hypothetical protein PR048_007207 [Dryococelus australis]|uniref:Uncharacterized protein n=1 Tax=Dryococelus australis TaxID=614101 RepID=A0ABQ9IEA3_9NEOP|nr:hypothetical protein PR048_007207 [Dryococelus australis]